MINALRRSDSIFLLIGKINGLSNEAKRARIRMRGAKEKGYKFAQRKRLVGADVRSHLLAYAFLRGTPYRSVEANCREDNAPHEKAIFQIAQLHAPTYTVYDPYTKTGGRSYSVKEEDIVNWLKEEAK